MTHTEIKRAEWLRGETEKWQSDGLVTEETAARIRERYPLPDRRSVLHPAVVVFAVLGAVFIGLGMILVSAWNWDSFSRPVRLTLSLIPLAASVGLLLFVFVKKRDSAAWLESASVFNGLALTGALALIGQIYQIPGDIDTLLLPVLLLYLPVVHLTGTLTSYLSYMLSLTVWACVAQGSGGNAAFFWILFPAALPRVMFAYRKKDRSPGQLARVWMALSVLSICLGVCLEKVMPGLWIVIYASFFALIYCYSYWPSSGEEDALHPVLGRPLRSSGFKGLIVLAFLLSYSWPWDGIGWNSLRDEFRFVSSLAWIDYLLVVLFFAGALVVTLITLIRKKGFGQSFGLLPLIAAGGYLAMSVHPYNETVRALINLAVNLFILHAGVLLIFWGINKRHLGEINLGAFVVALLVLLRFVFSEYFMEGLLARGIAFIVIGALFLAMNLVLARVFRKAEREVAP